MKIFWIVAGIVGGLFCCSMLYVLSARQMAARAERHRKAVWEFKQGPFGAILSDNTQPYQIPPEFHLDLKDVAVTSSTDNSDEKQALSRIEAETHSTNAPLLEVRWNRVVAGGLPEPRDLIYGRDALRLNYRIGNQTPLHCDKILAMDIYGMAHAPGVDIVRDMGTLSRRK